MVSDDKIKSDDDDDPAGGESELESADDFNIVLAELRLAVERLSNLESGLAVELRVPLDVLQHAQAAYQNIRDATVIERLIPEVSLLSHSAQGSMERAEWADAVNVVNAATNLVMGAFGFSLLSRAKLRSDGSEITEVEVVYSDLSLPEEPRGAPTESMGALPGDPGGIPNVIRPPKHKP